jgi:hypothetical protein
LARISWLLFKDWQRQHPKQKSRDLFVAPTLALFDTYAPTMIEHWPRAAPILHDILKWQRHFEEAPPALLRWDIWDDEKPLFRAALERLDTEFNLGWQLDGVLDDVFSRDFAPPKQTPAQQAAQVEIFIRSLFEQRPRRRRRWRFWGRQQAVSTP